MSPPEIPAQRKAKSFAQDQDFDAPTCLRPCLLQGFCPHSGAENAVATHKKSRVRRTALSTGNESQTRTLYKFTAITRAWMDVPSHYRYSKKALGWLYV